MIVYRTTCCVFCVGKRGFGFSTHVSVTRDVHGSDRIVGFLGSDRTGSDPIRSDKSDDPNDFDVAYTLYIISCGMRRNTLFLNYKKSIGNFFVEVFIISTSVLELNHHD